MNNYINYGCFNSILHYLLDKTQICTSNEELTFKNVPTLVAIGTNENFKSVQYYFIKINLNTLDSGPELTILFFSEI